jgi:hypothetical protein
MSAAERAERAERAEQLLTFYLREAWEAAGKPWGSDDDSEVGSIVDAIVQAAIEPFDVRRFAQGVIGDSLLTDSLMATLEMRIIALEEVTAARWPRRLLLAFRLGRSLRRSVARYGRPGSDFEGRRIEAAGDEWLDGRP